MKRLKSYQNLLLLPICTFLVLQSSSLMASNVDYTPVYIGTFNGTEVNGNNYNFPSSADSWAGFANLAQIYPLSFANGGTITFTGSAPNGDVGIYFRFESNPWPKVSPAFNTSSVTISGATPTEYTITIPSQGSNTFNSAVLYLTTRDTEVTLTDFRINATTHSTATKKRILVLHGHNSSGYLTRRDLPTFQQLEKALGDDYEFEYATAPSWHGPGYDWYGNLDNSLSYLSRIIDNTGPYYGVIGYSQGTSMIMSLINYKKNLPFERVVLFNGFAPGQIHWDHGSSDMQAILTDLNALKPLNNSVFVFVGYNDHVVPRSTSYLLSDFFKNSQTVTDYSRSSWDGHRPPYDDEPGFQEVVDFITSNDIDSDGVDDILDAYPHNPDQHTSEPLTLTKDNDSIRIDWDAKVNQNWKVYKTSQLSNENNTEIQRIDCTLIQDRLIYTESLDQDSSFYFIKSE